ncbi:hypothetical protein SAMN04487996_107131 [Dyadobacter soli]|uniref:Uncharacterized protein n=1 Tax=Dyadobacter soli TaxID=659014 RepID=A0A1G7G5I5_9BACT|nr:hypothetical protein [Dyadobacter soli]SDE83378.1 hypothetical protein SAMN04487996_107131 [Dyadobacter soli]
MDTLQPGAPSQVGPDKENDLNYWKRKAGGLADQVASLTRAANEATQAGFKAKCFLAELGYHQDMVAFEQNSPDIEDWEAAWREHYAKRVLYPRELPAAVPTRKSDLEKICRRFIGHEGAGEATKILNELTSAYMYQELRNSNLVDVPSLEDCLAKVDYAHTLVNFLVDVCDELEVTSCQIEFTQAAA